MFENITYVALDDHKRRHQVAVLLPGMKREEAETVPGFRNLGCLT